MSQNVFEGDPLSEYHKEHEEILHLEEEVEPMLIREVKARHGKKIPFSTFNREYQSLIHAYISTDTLSVITRNHKFFYYAFPSLILATSLSSVFFRKTTLLLLPISSYFWKYLHSLNMTALTHFLSSSREFDMCVRTAMKKSVAYGGVNKVSRTLATKHANVIITDLYLILDRALVLLSCETTKETEIRIKLKSIKQSRFLLLGDILVMFDPCKTWSNWEWISNGYSTRLWLDRLTREFTRMAGEINLLIKLHTGIHPLFYYPRNSKDARPCL
jgi:hypothetical protein